MSLFSLSYRHEYGIDLTLYASVEDAHKAACGIIANWFYDLSDHDSAGTLAELINAGEYVQALTLWGEIVGDCGVQEEITVQEVTVTPSSEIRTPHVDFFEPEPEDDEEEDSEESEEE